MREFEMKLPDPALAFKLLYDPSISVDQRKY